MKRGQASLFMIIGAVLVIVVILALIINAFLEGESFKTIQQNIFTPSEKQVVIDYVNACFTRTAYDALKVFGAQGGYVYPSFFIESFKIKDTYVPYYYYKGNNFMPSVDFLETTQLSDYIYFNLNNCIDDFRNFKGLGINEGSLKVKTNISEKFISFHLDYPLSLQQNIRQEALTGSYDLHVPLRVGHILGLASEITKRIQMQPTQLDLSYLLVMRDSGFDVTVIPYDEGTVLYRVRDNIYTLEKEPYVFQFAHKVRDK